MVTGLADASDGARLDPFKILADSGEEMLVSQLAELNLEHLRDVVAQFGMDPGRLVMKWKEPTCVRNTSWPPRSSGPKRVTRSGHELILGLELKNWPDR
jgi:hypothetical protein